MSKFYAAALGAGLILSATMAMSQSLTGGDVTIGYAGLTDSDFDTSGYNVGASGEMAFAREFAAQGDFSYTDGDVFGFSGDTVALAGHGIYHANENASFGLYYGQEYSDGDRVKYYGVEGGYGYEQLKVEGYFGVTAVDVGQYFDLTDDAAAGAIIGDIDLNQFGVSAAYSVNPMFSVTGRYDQIRFTEALQLSRLGAGVAADVGNNIGLSAEVGRLTADVVGYSDDATYANIGGTYTFGASRGATFGRRDSAHTVMGF